MADYARYAELLRKYDVPTPRYTSYPTVPFWDTDTFTGAQWKYAVRRCFQESNDNKGISIYVHLPFCESLCTYCACNTRITRNHAVESTYLQALANEWQIYKDTFESTPLIREIHFGGGTPTFFSATNLEKLVNIVLAGSCVHPEHEFSFEGHPNNTTYEHLSTLYNLGFSRVSYGVQDLDEKVQRTINRMQPFGRLQQATEESRSIGYKSISFDLIYGLPYQTVATVSNTLQKVLSLTPDRLSFYSYAHVPWMKPGQRGYEDADLPTDVEKRKLYETGRMHLKTSGYEDIGMDHFALRHDNLYKASTRGRLHRNFMGYTTSGTDLLIGLGASAISDARYAYAQNKKTVEQYTSDVAAGRLSLVKGHILSKRDLHIRRCILDIACQGNIHVNLLKEFNDPQLIDALYEMQDEGILSLNIDGFQVTELGRAFIRNVCSVFDERLNAGKNKTTSQLFSQSI